jgi:Tol biopolymer transport system component
VRNPKAIRWSIAATVMFATIVVIAPAASASYPGGNGDIAYAAFGRNLAVRAISPAGMDDHKISIGDTSAGDAEYVPDGGAAIIVEYPGRGSRLVRVDLDTSTRTVVLPANEAPSSIFSVGVSPDDTEVVFCALKRNGWRLFTVGMDGSDLTRISSGTDDCHADWGINGRIVATEELNSGAMRLFTMLPDGSDRQVVTTFPVPHWRIVYFMVPSWAPDANSIVFGAQFDDRDPEIWAIEPNGSNLTNLTNTPQRSEYGPLFSPDGARVAFTRERWTRRGLFAPGDLWTMDTGGGDIVRLTDTRRRDEYSRSWQALVP